MQAEKYQKAQYLREMLAEEANHGLNMQMVLAELPENDLQVIEKVARRCRTSRGPQSSTDTTSYMLDWEQQIA
jgi:hypothetical protein